MRLRAIKYNICLISLMIFTLPHFVFAQICSPEGYTVLTINGINTTDRQAKQNKDDLHYKLPPTYNNQELKVDYVYNPTHLLVIADALDTAQQALFLQKSDYDLTEMLNDASRKVTTQKLLLVAHSQGNFYGNNFYEKVADIEGGVPVQSIGMYGVASPASYVAGGGNYLTSDTDTVIASLPRKVLNQNVSILPPNIHIPSQPGNNGHGFSDIYLEYQASRIVSDINASLKKLQTNNIQDINSNCIAPQKLTLGHKIEKVVLKVADPLADKTLQGTLITGKYIVAGSEIARDTFLAGLNASKIAGTAMVDASIAFGNGVLKGAQIATNATVSAVGKFGKSIKNIALGIGAKNQANAIDAVSPENTNPEIINTENPILPIAKLIEIKPDIIPQVVIETPEILATVTPLMPPAPEPIIEPVVKEVLSNIHSRSHHNDTQDPPPPPDPVVEETPVVVPPDTNAPTITIVGANPMILKLNASYSELSATAVDDTDGDISANIIIDGTVDTTKQGTYTITYKVTDVAGNTATATRTVKVATYIYDSVYRYGTGNGDGNNWRVWYFNGTVFYDWIDTYVDHYLKEEYTMKHFGGPTMFCSVCIAHGIFKTNPLQGFESDDLFIPSLERNLQWVPDGVYKMKIQWDATGYSYNMSLEDGTLYEEGHIDVENVNKDMYSGWSADYNHNPAFTVPQTDSWWYGVLSYFPEGYEGGVNMTLEPYPVYIE